MDEQTLRDKGFSKQADGSWARLSKISPHGLSPAQPECVEKLPLVSSSPGEEEGYYRPPNRALIIFTVFSRRPMDWDNPRFKSLQDCLVKAGFLDGDDFARLEGRVISRKAHRKEDERTEVEIIPLA